jgi:hypothetical protein
MREYSTSENYPGKIVAGDHQVLRAVTVAGGQTLAAGAVLAEVAGKVQALDLEQAAAAEVLAAGDGAVKVFTGLLAQGGVVPGTVAVSATIGGAALAMSDDGRGRLSGEGVGKGSLDYGSGCYRLEFDAAPDNATDITADYSHDNGGAALAAAVLLEDIDASAGDEPGSALAHGEAVSDALAWPDGISDEQKARALNQLASAGIYAK